MKQGKLAISTIDVLGYTVVIIDRDQEREWYVPFSTQAAEQKVFEYLLEEGYLADWYGEAAVQEIVDQARAEAQADTGDQEAP